MGGAVFVAIAAPLKVGTAFGRGWKDADGRRADCAIVPGRLQSEASYGYLAAAHKASHSSVRGLGNEYPIRMWFRVKLQWANRPQPELFRYTCTIRAHAMF